MCTYQYNVTFIIRKQLQGFHGLIQADDKISISYVGKVSPFRSPKSPQHIFAISMDPFGHSNPKPVCVTITNGMLFKVFYLDWQNVPLIRNMCDRYPPLMPKIEIFLYFCFELKYLSTDYFFEPA